MWALDFRPKKFEDVVGQNHVVQILQNLQKQDNIPSGLLFAGSRGTGKTSMARILAEALNCESDEVPCGKCSSCKAVAKGIADFVLEIDAASHGLVDDIRELREAVKYSHTGKCRVCIIDEAHSLSRSAFNAFLKVLEEPPANVLFVLVTTEPSKILDTVRSRLMPFTFRQLSVDAIKNRLCFILQSENIDYSDKACELIARKAEGGMRDAIVTAEQLYYYNNDITESSFKELFGIVEDDIYRLLLQTIFEDKRKEALLMIEKYFYKVGEKDAFLKGLLDYLKRVLIGMEGGDVLIPDELLSLFTVPDILKCMDKVWDYTIKTKTSAEFYSVSAVMLYVELANYLTGDEGKDVPYRSFATSSSKKEAGSVLKSMAQKGLL